MWIIFSILAAFYWAIVNTVDKYILTKWVRQPIIPVIILGIIGLIVSIIVYFIYGFSFLSNFNIFLALVTGIFYPSILKEEIGKSVIFLKLLAIILMFVGALLIT